jgi:hypothetical protein
VINSGSLPVVSTSLLMIKSHDDCAQSILEKKNMNKYSQKNDLSEVPFNPNKSAASYFSIDQKVHGSLFNDGN